MGTKSGTTSAPFVEDDLEQAVISLFREQGYEYSRGEELHRESSDILLSDDLNTFLDRRYGAAGLSDVEKQKIVNRLALLPSMPLYTSNKAAFQLVTEGFDLVRDDPAALALHVEYIDFDHPENNIFRVVNQYSVALSSSVAQDVETRRPDILLFINGIPVCIWELKSVANEITTVYKAWEQITIRYRRDIPNLLKYCFLSVISDGVNTKLGSVFTPYAFYYAWNKVERGDKPSHGVASLLTMVKGAFAPQRLLQILRDFVYYPDESTKEEVIVARYPQFFAAEALFANIRNHLRPAGDGKGGTYFGATGSGKTYAMLYLARLLCLRRQDIFKNPTILILEDREDLEDQTGKIFENAKKFLHQDEKDVCVIKSREDLGMRLRNRPSGGVYVATIQKFCDTIGLLSDRANIICMSDEAHRTQVNTGSKLRITAKGAYTAFGFAKYLRDSFPRAVYCGFTGTPIDETIAVFGPLVDQYTMKESSDDGITVGITYEPRLAKVKLSDEELQEIEKYYDKCTAAGSNPEQVEESKKAMSTLSVILGNPERIGKIARDMVAHYESLCAEKPGVVQKAMIVCSDRSNAFKLLQAIGRIRPDWLVMRKAEQEKKLPKQELDKLVALPKINLVATQGANDPEDLMKACGTKSYRNMLSEQFKNNQSNFKIAIVVDMWITGFDVPSLSVMYIDKPIQKHTLIQTISRVNRVFTGKDRGLIVDYIGIQKDMDQAVKQYTSGQESPINELEVSLDIFRNHLSLLDDLMAGFDASAFYGKVPLERLLCLDKAAEYVQAGKERQTEFMGLSKRLKSAYQICFPSGELTDAETAKAQFYMAVRSIIYKQTRGGAPDAEQMNAEVEQMVKKAIECTGVENILDGQGTIDIYSDEFLKELRKVKLPITKFNMLLKLVRKAIRSYGRVNKVKAISFSERLKQVVEAYNTRDTFVFDAEGASRFMDDLSAQIMDIMKDLKEDQDSFQEMGISYEEKAFYDILVKVRDDHGFRYPDEKCITLAKEIKKLVDDKTKYADWATRSDIQDEFKTDLTILLYHHGYPPQWNTDVFRKVMDQTENFKKYENL